PALGATPDHNPSALTYHAQWRAVCRAPILAEELPSSSPLPSPSRAKSRVASKRTPLLRDPRRSAPHGSPSRDGLALPSPCPDARGPLALTTPRPGTSAS